MGRSCASGVSQPRTRSLAALVRSYRMLERKRALEELETFRREPSIRAAVSRAALAQTPGGKRLSHQNLISRASLQQAEARLVDAQLELCRTFDELLQRVTELTTGIFRFGPLARYDAAVRIGAKLGLWPDRVYLHRGTRDGAIALGLDPSKGYIEMAELPSPIRELEPHEVEDFLCIYKDELHT